MSLNWLLFAAIRRGATSDVASILDTGNSDVNARDESGWTPLMRAAGDNNVEIVQLLLRYGADPGIKDAKGLSVRSLAGPEVRALLPPMRAPVEVRAVAVEPPQAPADLSAASDAGGPVVSLPSQEREATAVERREPPTDMAGATDLVLRCKALKPLSADAHGERRAILDGLSDLTEDRAHTSLLLFEVLGALDNSPAVFRLLVRDVGVAYTQLHFEITTTHLCYHYEYMEAMSDSWQSSECKYFDTDLRGLPAGVAVEVQGDHDLLPTYTLTLRGVAADAAERVETAVRGLFVRVWRRS